MIENVSGELKKYLEGKPFFSALLSFDMIILYVSVALMLLGDIISLGSFINALIFYVFMLGIVLCLANANFQALMIGLGVRAIIAIVNLFQGFFWEYGGYLSWSALFALLIYGYFAYASYNKTLKKA